MVFPSGLGADCLAHMLEYDENIENDYLTLVDLDVDKVMNAEKTMIICAEDVDAIPRELLEDSVFVIQKNNKKPDVDPLYVFEFNIDLFRTGIGFGYTKDYFNDLFGIELKPEAKVMYENTIH